VKMCFNIPFAVNILIMLPNIVSLLQTC